MIDKSLLRLLGKNRKYIVYCVALMLVGLLANVCITASLCRAVALLLEGTSWRAYWRPLLPALLGLAVRYGTSRLVGDLRDTLGRKVKKDLRQQVYEKILRLGVRSSEEMSMAGLTQVSVEGIEQLDLYYSSYIPQFFFALLAPVVLFL